MRSTVAIVHYTPELTGAMRLDAGLLSREFDVVTVRCRTAWDCVILPLRLRGVNAVYVLYADCLLAPIVAVTHSIGIPVLLVLGGYGVNSVPDIGYGYATWPWWRKAATRWGVHRADKVIAVSRSLANQFVKVYWRWDVEVVYNAVDTSVFNDGKIWGDRRITAITVAGISSTMRYKLKGWDKFREIATLLPDYTFVAVGAQPVSQQEVARELIGARYYLNLSRVDACPNAVLEALACGCTVLTLNNGGATEVIGDAGRVFDEFDTAEIAQVIRSGWRGKEWDGSRFTLDVRAEKLNGLISALLRQARGG